MFRNSHLEWKVPYEPGKLEAIAWKDGKEIRSQMETTEEPAQIVIVPDKTSICTGGLDAVVVNINVTDRSGREVPDADNLIQFSVTGDAEIIGVGNGDPGSHESDKCAVDQWQRKLFNGKCQMILKSGENPGTIEITAKSEGLIFGSVRLQQLSCSSGR